MIASFSHGSSQKSPGTQPLCSVKHRWAQAQFFTQLLSSPAEAYRANAFRGNHLYVLRDCFVPRTDKNCLRDYSLLVVV
jgi:hypothetical protein